MSAIFHNDDTQMDQQNLFGNISLINQFFLRQNGEFCVVLLNLLIAPALILNHRPDEDGEKLQEL